MSEDKRYKIVYCTPALYMAGGVERVLTLKANYFVEHFGYDITIILTEGEGKPLFYPLSEKVKLINLNIGFEELWTCSFIKKVFIYLKKQYLYKKLLTNELLRIRPDITISLLRREINFITSINDGSKKIGELHINRAHYRNFEGKNVNVIKKLFSLFWMNNLLSKLRRLDCLVVLTEKDREAWSELINVVVIPNPLSFTFFEKSGMVKKRVIAIGRYCYEKGYDQLLQAWAIVQTKCPEWQLVIFGDGDRSVYKMMIDEFHIDADRCLLNGRTPDVISEYVESSIAVCSSRFEGFGMVIIEAMACGLPVVSFDCPWGPEAIINNGEDGLLVENGNMEALAKALILMIHNPEKRREMANKAVENVQRFRIEQISEKWKTLFDSL